MSCWKSVERVRRCVRMQLRCRRPACVLIGNRANQAGGWGARSIHHLVPKPPAVPCHVVYTNAKPVERSSRPAVWIINLTQVSPFPWELRTEPLTSSLSGSSPQTSSVARNGTERLDSTQDQHAEQQQTLFSPLGSTSAISFYLSRVLALELSKNNTVSYFPRPKWFNVQLGLKKAGGFVWIHSRHTSPTHFFPVLSLPVSFCLFLCL